MSNIRNSIEELKSVFSRQNCVLLEDEYVNAHTKMRYRCICGRESTINWNNFRSGKRCGCQRIGVRRLDEEDIRQEVEEKGCQFVSSDYTKGHVINYVCRCGSMERCQLKSFRKSEGCRVCRDKSMCLSIEDVRQCFVEQGCQLLEQEYKNARTKMNYRCSCGELASIVYDSFRQGNRCKQCGNAKISTIMKCRTGMNNPRWIADRSKKRENDLFAQRCRSMLRSSLYALGVRKNDRTELLLGYRFSDLKKHLETFPSWGMLRDQFWHIDHIFPLKAFMEYGIKDLRIVNCLSNLQPMLGCENISKSAKYNCAAFEEWLKSKGVSFDSRV